MSYNLGLIACATIQDDLDNNFACLNAIEPMPFVEILTSSANMSGISTTISPGSGKYRTVKMLYTPRHPESVVSTTVGFDCTAANESSVLDEDYSIDTTAGVFVDEKFTVTTMNAACKDNSMWFAERIQAMFDVLTRRLETLYTTQISALVGSFASDDKDHDGNAVTTLKNVKTLGSDGKITPDFIQEIAFTAMTAGFCASPLVIGGTLIWKAFNTAYAGCCAQYGTDIGAFLAQNQAAFFYSNRIETALGSNEFLVYEIGKVQPLFYNRFASEFATVNDESYKQMTIKDPRTGIVYDVTMKWDCGVLHVQLGLATKLVGLPSDIFDFGDRLYQTNGVYNFKVVN